MNSIAGQCLQLKLAINWVPIATVCRLSQSKLFYVPYNHYSCHTTITAAGTSSLLEDLAVFANVWLYRQVYVATHSSSPTQCLALFWKLTYHYQMFTEAGINKPQG